LSSNLDFTALISIIYDKARAIAQPAAPSPAAPRLSVIEHHGTLFVGPWHVIYSLLRFEPAQASKIKTTHSAHFRENDGFACVSAAGLATFCAQHGRGAQLMSLCTEDSTYTCPKRALLRLLSDAPSSSPPAEFSFATSSPADFSFSASVPPDVSFPSSPGQGTSYALVLYHYLLMPLFVSLFSSGASASAFAGTVAPERKAGPPSAPSMQLSGASSGLPSVSSSIESASSTLPQAKTPPSPHEHEQQTEQRQQHEQRAQHGNTMDTLADPATTTPSASTPLFAALRATLVDGTVWYHEQPLLEAFGAEHRAKPAALVQPLINNTRRAHEHRTMFDTQRRALVPAAKHKSAARIVVLSAATTDTQTHIHEGLSGTSRRSRTMQNSLKPSAMQRTAKLTA
jgi:hypothetical protein